MAGGGGPGVLGQQQHPGRGPGLADQVDQVGDGRAGHLGVDHQHVGPVGADRLQGRGAVAGQGHHLEVVLGREDHAEALDERVVVVGQDDPDRLPHCRSPRETPIRC
jgi:hypothetical protein